MTNEPAARTNQGDEILRLISAVATGDAVREDVTSALRDKGIDSLDVLIEVLAQATRRSERPAPQFLDPHLFANPGPERSSTAVHPIPEAPFVLRGVLYDPMDIGRFNDRDLHMIVGRPGEPLLAIDDRALMVNWWQLSCLTAMTARLKTRLPEGSSDILVGPEHPTTDGGGGRVGILSGPESGGHPGLGPGALQVPPGPVRPLVPHTNFFEDYNFDGDRLVVGAGGYVSDLTDLSSGFLGLGSDWNDRISSVQMIATTMTILWEDVNQGGSSTTLSDSMGGIPGWNDRASAVFTY